MAGLLDFLSAPDNGNGIGGLLSYLQSPLYQVTQSKQDDRVLQQALLQGSTEGALPQLTPSPSIWDQPGVNYSPAPAPSVFAGGAPPVAGLPQFNPQPPALAPQQPPPVATPPAPLPPTNTMNIGGYQMPQIGTAADYTPQVPKASSDVSAQSQPSQPLPPALGGSSFGGNLGAGLQSFANTPGGLIPKLMGGAGALFTGQRSDPQGIQQQNLKAQYDSLVPLLGPQKALLAVMNPEAGKTLLNEALTNKEKYGVISEDPLEGKKYGFINELEQTVNGKPINQNSSSSGGSMGAVQQAQQAGVQGSALYDYMPKPMVPIIKAMVEGRQPLPSGMALRSPATLALIEAAHAVDPTFDATTWKARNEAGPDWTKGKSSEMVRAANQTLAHVGSLMNAMDNMGNTRIPAVNAVKNFANEQTGGGEPGAFRTNAHAVAEEMSKVFKGANLSDSEIRHWEQNLSENMSPAQQRAQIAKLSELLHGSLQALEEKRVAAMGPAMAEKQGPLIKEEGQQVLKRIDSWLQSNGTGNSTKTGVSWSIVK